MKADLSSVLSPSLGRMKGSRSKLYLSYLRYCFAVASLPYQISQ